MSRLGSISMSRSAGVDRFAGGHKDLANACFKRLADDLRLSQRGNHGAIGRQLFFHPLPTDGRRLHGDDRPIVGRSEFAVAASGG